MLPLSASNSGAISYAEPTLTLALAVICTHLLRGQIRTIIIYVMTTTGYSRMSRLFLLISAVLLTSLAGAGVAQAADHEAKLVILNHQFVPSTLTVPAGVKFKLLVENQDATPEEFESNDLNREKIVLGKSTITVFLGPLEPGKYHFFGDFHQETAQGELIAK